MSSHLAQNAPVPEFILQAFKNKNNIKKHRTLVPTLIGLKVKYSFLFKKEKV